MLVPVPLNMKRQKSSKASTPRGLVGLLPTLLALVSISSEMNIPPRNIKDMFAPSSSIKEELSAVSPQVSESRIPLREFSSSSEMQAPKGDGKEGIYFPRELSTPKEEVIGKDHQENRLERNQLTYELSKMKADRSSFIKFFAIASKKLGLPLEAEKLQVFPPNLVNYERKAKESLNENDLKACKKYLQLAQKEEDELENELKEYFEDIQESMNKQRQNHDSSFVDLDENRKNDLRSALENLEKVRESLKVVHGQGPPRYDSPRGAAGVSTHPFETEKLERNAMRSLNHNLLDSAEKYLELADQQLWGWMQSLYHGL